MNRRSFAAAAISAATLSAGTRATQAATPATPATGSKAGGPLPGGIGTPFQIGMLVFDNMTNLDFVGPHDIFSRIDTAQVHVLAKTLEPITTDAQLKIVPQKALRDSPPLDLIFVGGGPGTNQLMEDREVIDFLVAHGPTAQYITSVCTGALVLGAAGLLKGYKATTHWASLKVLPLFGAEPVQQRVVFDRNRITGGGVTAGIDFGFALVGKLWGDDQAQILQLAMEYAPDPPYDAGSTLTAPAAIVERTTRMLHRLTDQRLEIARRVTARWS